MNTIEAYDLWKLKARDDQDLITELQSIEFDMDEIFDRFYRDLEFGTGGLRGIIGAGTNRMNIYTVRKATGGLANYLLSKKKTSVAIAYDSRIKSDLFAKTAASVLATNGIKVYIYPELMPTPALSFAVRYLGCDAGICVTASHNPAKYNGYKVYGSDGCQITLEMATLILEQIHEFDVFEDVKYMTFEEGINKNLIEYINEKVVDKFMSAVKSQSISRVNPNLKIIYTPLNGAGKACVLRILKEIGVTDIMVVPEQANPDGNFPTCPYPNPEKKEALEKGLELCKKTGADLLLATDPDCDRVGIAVKTKSGNYQLLSGNEVGILLLDYIAKLRIQNNSMPNGPIAVKTIVTTDMAKEVAKDYGIKIIDTLTGFKFIGEQIGLLEKNKEEERYIFGFEESYGYLSGSYVRDKDAVGASMLICEMSSYYLEQGLSLVEQINILYKKYGYYQNRLLDYSFEGAKGMEQMKQIMKNLRENYLTKIGTYHIVSSSDYKTSIKKVGDNIETISLPKSNVLEYILDNKSKVIIRPSGTEPKIKVYLTTCESTLRDSKRMLDVLEEELDGLFH